MRHNWAKRFVCLRMPSWHWSSNQYRAYWVRAVTGAIVLKFGQEALLQQFLFSSKYLNRYRRTKCYGKDTHLVTSRYLGKNTYLITSRYENQRIALSWWAASYIVHFRIKWYSSVKLKTPGPSSGHGCVLPRPSNYVFNYRLIIGFWRRILTHLYKKNLSSYSETPTHENHVLLFLIRFRYTWLTCLKSDLRRTPAHQP